MGAMVSRRSLIIGAVSSAAAIATVGVARLDPPAVGRRVLSEEEAAIVAATALTMFPRGVFPVDGVEAGVVENVDLYLADHMPAVHAAGFRYLLQGLQWGPLYSHGARFTELSPAARTEVLQIWGEPSVLARRVALDALKAVFAAAWIRSPDVQRTMGWRASCGGGVA
jgi:hypothetical protein